MGNFIRSVLSAASAILQQKTVTAQTTQQTVSPDDGYDGLSSVVVNPQDHDQYYTPTTMNDSGTNNDMGAHHNNRYVNTTGMYKPSGTYSGGSYTSNGTKTITGLENYAAASFKVNVSASLSATTLWTGAGGSAYSGGYAVLSQSMANFSYLRVKFKRGTTGSQYFYVLVEVQDFISNTGPGSSKFQVGASYSSSSNTHIRLFSYSTTTQISFTACMNLETGSVLNTLLIPVSIEGLK